MPDSEKTTLYAQFDGDEVDGKRYRYGEPLDDKVDHGTRAVVVSMGRFSASQPSPHTAHIPVGTRVEDMSRLQLISTAVAEGAFDDASDDDLRDLITRVRANKAGDEDGDETYADLKDRPLDKLNVAQLDIVAQGENVTFAEDVKTKGDRAKAIQAARDAAKS